MLQTSPVWALVWLFFQIQCSLFVFFWASDSQFFTFTLRAQSRCQSLLRRVLLGPRIGGSSLRHHPKKGKQINLTKRIKWNPTRRISLLSSPEAQKNLVDRVLSARRNREEEDPGEGENSKFQPWEVQEGDAEPLCGGTLLSTMTKARRKTPSPFPYACLEELRPVPSVFLASQGPLGQTWKRWRSPSLETWFKFRPDCSLCLMIRLIRNRWVWALSLDCWS